ncbi:uncharacterized protein LOC125030422 [Penaeus chinensis]|uniref:uncharacterized protein LOC125030422 n=1 Tax=Penaeus chinensis TaxID=139456 RepID=UPI001FB6FF4E|nr:uncharacterized protein LOC125030422 [Penaeus chinensis]
MFSTRIQQSGKRDVQMYRKLPWDKSNGHTMKLFERVLDARIREGTDVSEQQFGFMPGKGTTDVIFIFRQLMEKYAEKQKDLHFVFIDLEKAYDRVPRQVVGLHQGSAFSPYLSDLIMDVLAYEVKEGVTWSMLFANDIVLVGTSKLDVERKLEQWKRALEGSHITSSGDKDVELNHRILPAWANWRRTSGALCDKEINLKLKGRVYKSVVSPAMVYGAETWPIKKAEERKLEV